MLDSNFDVIRVFLAYIISASLIESQQCKYILRRTLDYRFCIFSFAVERNAKLEFPRKSSRSKDGAKKPTEPHATNSKELKTEERPAVKANAKFGEELENCGLPAKCQDDEIAMQLYTGRENKDPPKICVDGK
jgi:hypothetical protein